MRRLAAVFVFEPKDSAGRHASGGNATKTVAWRGLWSSPKLVDRLGLDRVGALERLLAAQRGRVEFNIAVVIA